MVKDCRCELRDRRAMNQEIRVATIVGQTPGLDIVATTDSKYSCECTNWEQFASTEKRAAL
eukprot:6543855-Pyramimonas_sp.AAC.1